MEQKGELKARNRVERSIKIMTKRKVKRVNIVIKRQDTSDKHFGTNPHALRMRPKKKRAEEILFQAELDKINREYLQI